jgi:DNA-binding response OmpR family regulator
MPPPPGSSSPKADLLIADDDPDVRNSLVDLFAQEGYAVQPAACGADALQEMTTLPPYDLVLLDLRLPQKTGFEVLREARQGGVDSPVILLTVKDEHTSKIRGFDLGADDYVTKPFDPRELVARVRAVLARSAPALPTPDDAFTFGDCTIHFPTETVAIPDADVDLTDLEFDILAYLVRHRGRTVSREQLLRDVWGISGTITTRTIDRHVASLRKKIEPRPESPIYLTTVYGIGYKFVADASASPD